MSTIWWTERVEARQTLAPIRRQVRLMPQQLEELGEHVPEERFIIDHEHLHFVVAPVRVKVASVGDNVARMAGAVSANPLGRRACPNRASR